MFRIANSEMWSLSWNYAFFLQFWLFNSDLFFYFVLILLAQKCCWNWHFITLKILYMLAVQRKRSNINCTDKACDNTQIKTFRFSVGSFQLNSAVTGFRLSYRDRKLFPYQQFITVHSNLCAGFLLSNQQSWIWYQLLYLLQSPLNKQGDGWIGWDVNRVFVLW